MHKNQIENTHSDFIFLLIGCTVVLTLMPEITNVFRSEVSVYVALFTQLRSIAILINSSGGIWQVYIRLMPEVATVPRSASEYWSVCLGMQMAIVTEYSTRLGQVTCTLSGQQAPTPLRVRVVYTLCL